MSQKPKIIPTKLKNRIRKAAQREAASLWEIADLANEVMQHVRLEQAKERLIGVYDFQVWATIGELCAKSGGRVKKLAAIAEAFSVDTRAPYIERWDFGYFERAYDVGPPQADPITGEIGKDERVQAMEFLDDYAKGDLSEGVPHEPTVGDFMPMYRQHILGLETRGGGDLENFPISPGISTIPDAPTPTPLENLRDALNQAYAYIVVTRGDHSDILELIDALDGKIKELSAARISAARTPVEEVLIEN